MVSLSEGLLGQFAKLTQLLSIAIRLFNTAKHFKTWISRNCGSAHSGAPLYQCKLCHFGGGGGVKGSFKETALGLCQCSRVYGSSRYCLGLVASAEFLIAGDMIQQLVALED